MTAFASPFSCVGISTSRRPAVLLYRTPRSTLHGEFQLSLVLADGKDCPLTVNGRRSHTSGPRRRLDRARNVVTPIRVALLRSSPLNVPDFTR